MLLGENLKCCELVIYENITHFWTHSNIINGSDWSHLNQCHAHVMIIFYVSKASVYTIGIAKNEKKMGAAILQVDIIGLYSRNWQQNCKISFPSTCPIVNMA